MGLALASLGRGELRASHRQQGGFKVVKQARSIAPQALVLLVAVAAALVVWLALDEGSATTEGVSPDSALAARSGPTRAQADEALSTPAESGNEPSGSASTAQAAPERAAVDEAAERELADALWVEGRVVWPEGTPLDEELEVVADGKDFKQVGQPKGKHRVRVGADGRFRVAFRNDTKAGSLSIAARYCYLAAPFKLKPASPPETIVLEPELGGCIVGVITPPANARDVELVRGKAQVESFGWGVKREPQQQRAKLDASWRYELRGLAVELQHRVEFDAQVWAPVKREAVRVEAGKLTTIDLACELGATLRGVVVDDAGEPVGNASVVARVESESANVSGDTERHAQAGAQGEFALRGVPTGSVVLEVTREGYLDKKQELGVLSDGEAREGLRIVLDAGRFVAGVVTWDDGAPAERAMVQIEETRDNARVFFGEPKGHRVDAQGRFKITGLGEGPYKVVASAPEASRPRPEGVEAPKLKNSGPKWRAEVRGAMPGAELALVLGPGASLAGVVVDESGAAVEKFTIRVLRRTTGMVFGSTDDVASRKFDAPDGRFVLEGLGDGAWCLLAQAKGYTDSELVPVDVPYSGPELKITLPRAARLAGLVVDPSGKPLADAAVEVERERDVFTGRRDEESRSSDAQGRFEVRNAPSGLVRLRATHPKFAASPTLELRLAPGEERTDLRLELSEGGTIRGRIAQNELRGGENWSVNISSKGGGWDYVTTDAAGAFVFERVRPGEHRISAHVDRVELNPGKGAIPRMLHTNVTVEAGTTVEVVLGALSAQPLELRGRVTIGGEPAAGAALFVSRKGFVRNAECADDGSYSLVVDGPGRYNVNARLRASDVSHSAQIDIADGAPTVHDIAFHDARLRGRVIDAAGEPVANASVQLALVRAESEAQGGAQSANVDTDGKGVFELRGLTPGEHRLTVSDGLGFGEARFGALVREGLVVAGNAATEELVLRVEPGIALRCRVRGVDGGAAIGASVTVRAPSGPPVERAFGDRHTDGAGACTLTGLSSGDHIVVAWLDDAVGASSVVRVKSGEPREVEIALRRGGRIAITRSAAAGAAFTGKVAVLDEAGFDWGAGAAPWSVQGEVWSVGPLPPGAYTVRSNGSNGQVVEVAASVRAGDVQAVTLQLTAQ